MRLKRECVNNPVQRYLCLAPLLRFLTLCTPWGDAKVRLKNNLAQSGSGIIIPFDQPLGREPKQQKLRSRGVWCITDTVFSACVDGPARYQSLRKEAKYWSLSAPNRGCVSAGQEPASR